MTAEFWDRMTRPGPEVVTLDGIELRRGSRVRLRPSRTADLFDARLSGRTGTIEGFDEEQDGVLHVSVTLEDDPGRELGEGRHPGHRFFFRLEEIEPLEAPAARVLIAGIGNVFLGDDGYGVAAARCLAAGPRRPGVEIVDFGIRALDLAYALQSAWDGVVLLDATKRGGPPGTLYVIEPEAGAGTDVPLETHGMSPATVLALARTLGRTPGRALVVGCEPEFIPDQTDPEALTMELSPPVRSAVQRTVPVVESVLADWCGPVDDAEPRPADVRASGPEGLDDARREERGNSRAVVTAKAEAGPAVPAKGSGGSGPRRPPGRARTSIGTGRALGRKEAP